MKKHILVVGALPEAFEEIRRALEDSTTEVMYSGAIDDAMNKLSLHKVLLIIMELGYLCEESERLFRTLRRKKPAPLLILFTNADVIDDYWDYTSRPSDDLPDPLDVKEWSVNVKAYIEQGNRIRKSVDAYNFEGVE